MESSGEKSVLHPYFHKKIVYQVKCVYCNSELTNRGMKAILLADTMTNLYSTDIQPKSSIELIGKYFTTETCSCKIKNFACLTCGNPVGYQVALPCAQCLESCNNGHLWIFHCYTTTVSKRMDACDKEVLTWGELTSEDGEDTTSESTESLCR